MTPTRVTGPSARPPSAPSRAPIAGPHPPGRGSSVRRRRLLAVPLLASVATIRVGDGPGSASILASITILGSGRLGPTLSALIGLTGAAIGGQALVRATRATATGSAVVADGRRAAAAVVLGAISLVLGVVFLAAADAGPGTGNGVVGSVAAIALGPIAMVLGGMARVRGGRAHPQPT